MHSKTSSTQSLFIDYGSGYNPKKGYKTCDFTTNPCLDYNVIDYKIYNKDGELPHKSVSIFRLRNVIHHIPNLQKLFENLKNYLMDDGVIEIIDVNEEHYKQNLCLDNLWYRYVNKRNDIWISQNYRDYAKIASKMFKILHNFKENEKECIVLTKC